jgi:predicted GNAT family acetyltransferase
VHQYLRYTFAGAFRPYVGPWLEWIEPLDDAREMEPVALGLLARFDRGVYVIRQSGHIVSYAGLRQQSPHVWDLIAQTQAHDLRGHGLGRAVVSRATRAALGAGRLPLAAHLAGDQAATRVGRALGYRIYGETLVYSMRT